MDVVPSSLLGVMVLVVLMAPGLAYVLRHERAVSAPNHTALRETLRVIFISVLCLSLVGVFFALLRAVVPSMTPDVRALLLNPNQDFVEHRASIMWWASGLVACATLIGFCLADPRLISRRSSMRSSGMASWLLGKPDLNPIANVPPWIRFFSDLNNGTKKKSYVGVVMSDGDYIEGHLVNFSTEFEGDDRTLMLTRCRVTQPSGYSRDLPYSVVSVVARDIVRLDVTYLDTPSPASSGPPLTAPAPPEAKMPKQKRRRRQPH